MINNARIKLTAWYLVIIMLISTSFSIGVYKILIDEVERFGRAQRFRIEHPVGQLPVEKMFPKPPLPRVDPDLVREVKINISTRLIFINTIIFIVSGALGYFLSGKTLKPIKKMIDDQNRFISDASHEIRTPLTALKSSLEVFLRDKDSDMESARELMKDNIKDIDDLDRLTNSLLLATQYSKPNGNYKIEKVKLNEIIGSVSERIGKQYKHKNIKLSSSLSGVEIEGDKYSLGDLFKNLIENAYKYNKDGGEINIMLRVQGGQAVVSIEDTGIGISKENLPHVFDRFFRADSSRTQSHLYGYGLGLSIVKSIVESYKGWIDISSELEKGTKVVVYLPVKHSSKNLGLFSDSSERKNSI